jgi:HEAT repeat protein
MLMDRTPHAVLVLGLAWFLFSAEGEPHGGRYIAPSHPSPPKLGGNPMAPPGIPGAPSIPGATSGPGKTGQTPPFGGPARTGPLGLGTRRARTGASEQPVTLPDKWESWWDLHRDEYWPERPLPSGTGAQAIGVGRGEREADIDVDRATREDIEKDIVPALRAALASPQADIADSAALALGRVLKDGHCELVFDDLVGALASPHRSVQEAAAIALGVLGDRRAREVLSALAQESPRVRQLVRSSEPLGGITRELAALGLGLLEDPASASALEGLINGGSGSSGDLRTCSVIALGFLPQDQDLVRFLQRRLDESSLDSPTRAQIPAALASLGAPAQSAVPALLRKLLSDRTELGLRRGCVHALGKLASPEMDDVVRALIELARGKDAPSRHHAWIALGEIAARDGDGAERDELHRELLALSCEGVSRPRYEGDRPWSAFGLALHARARKALRAEAATSLRAAFAGVTSASERSALAISLGLIEAGEHANALMTALGDSTNAELNANLATALALMKCTAAVPYLRACLAMRALDWRYRQELARALVALGDDRAVPALVDGVISARTHSEQASYVLALGTVRNRNGIAPLVALLGNASAPVETRGLAAAALGLIGEPGTTTWIARVHGVLSGFEQSDAITEILDWF